MYIFLCINNTILAIIIQTRSYIYIYISVCISIYQYAYQTYKQIYQIY